MENVQTVRTISMTYHEQRRQAEDLLRRNYTVAQIAKELGLQIRTVTRWAKLLREGKPEPNGAQVVKAEVVEQIQSTTGTGELKIIGFPGSYEQWDAALTKKFAELGKFHEKERLKHQSILDQKITKGDVTARDCNSLSQAITRHAQEELRMFCMGKSDLLNFSQSYATLKTGGFGIYKIQSESENETFSQSDSTSENRNENLEGDSTT